MVSLGGPVLPWGILLTELHISPELHICCSGAAPMVLGSPPLYSLQVCYVSCLFQDMQDPNIFLRTSSCAMYVLITSISISISICISLSISISIITISSSSSRSGSMSKRRPGAQQPDQSGIKPSPRLP